MLIAEIGFVSFVGDVTNEVCPGDAVGGSDEPRVGYGAERFADVGGVGDVAVGAQEDGTESGCIGCVADVGVCGLVCSGYWEGI